MKKQKAKLVSKELPRNKQQPAWLMPEMRKEDNVSGRETSSSWLWPSGAPVFVAQASTRALRQRKAAVYSATRKPIRSTKPITPPGIDVLASHTNAQQREEPAQKPRNSESIKVPVKTLSPDVAHPPEVPPICKEPAGLRRAAEPQSPAEPEQFRATARPAQPIRANRKEILAGRFSRIWNAHLSHPAYGLSYLWEGYFALEKGAVLNLEVGSGCVTALVDSRGTEQVQLNFTAVDPVSWQALVHKCGASYEGWVALLTGKIHMEDIYKFYADSAGLIPLRREIVTKCTCLMSTAKECVHITTTLLAIGAWLQAHPLDLLTLRCAKRDVLFQLGRRLRGDDPLVSSAFTEDRVKEIFGLSSS